MDFFCKPCNKSYKSSQSLSNHNSKFHSTIINNKKEFSCVNCNKKFSRKNNMMVHINKTCKEKDNNNINLYSKDNNNLTKSVDNTNLNTINKIETNNGSVNNGTINNSTVNNIIYINKTGSESLLDLSKQDIKEIFDKNIDSIGTFIKKINFNENLPSNHFAQPI